MELMPVRHADSGWNAAGMGLNCMERLWVGRED